MADCYYISSGNGNTGSNGVSSDYSQIKKQLTTKEQDANGKRIMKFLMKESKMKMTKKQAAAFAGCFGLESGWNPSAQNPSKVNKDYGIAQWTVTWGSRQDSLKTVRKDDWSTLDGQLKFVEYELTNVYKSQTNNGTFNYTKIMPILADDSLSLEEMTWIVVQLYEAGKNANTYRKQLPSDYSELHLKQRISWAKRAFELV